MTDERRYFPPSGCHLFRGPAGCASGYNPRSDICAQSSISKITGSFLSLRARLYLGPVSASHLPSSTTTIYKTAASASAPDFLIALRLGPRDSREPGGPRFVSGIHVFVCSWFFGCVPFAFTSDKKQKSLWVCRFSLDSCQPRVNSLFFLTMNYVICGTTFPSGYRVSEYIPSSTRASRD